MDALDSPLSLAETFGLSPLSVRLREALVTFRGDEGVPPSRFDRTSLGILDPVLGVGLWLGRRRADGRVAIYNLFNHTQTPIADGWSVRRTQVRDFRGGTLTYDSHNGTDFAVPPGTVVVAAAPARVLRVSSEFNRGGLKIFLDHGGGLVTTSNHLGRALVRPGDLVRRGQPIARSGASGIDMFLMFPWNVPHVHFNVWLGTEPVDPFALPGEPSLWRRHNDPVPDDGSADDADFTPTPWEPERIEAGIAACTVADVRAALRAIPALDERAMALLFQYNYYPTRFPERPGLHAGPCPRRPRLDLPFRATDAVGIAFPNA
ncbi:MAG: M23 family metallopeptidase [bacterium]|nr:M23 family metallopeptidase [bacterium]